VIEMPNWQVFMIPVLRVMDDGAIRSRQEMRGPVADLMGLTAEQRGLALTSGQMTYENRMGWALSYLSNVGALERTGRNRYRITPGGHVVLQHFPTIATEAQLEQFAKDPSTPINPYKRPEAEPSPNPNPPVTNPEPEMLTPTEQVERGISRIKEDVASELLSRLQDKEPAFFEQAVVDLLLAMGYGGTNGRGQVTSLTNDNGIDGVIDQDVLGLSRVYVQAKRYEGGNSVQRPEVQGFVGALSGRADGGVFITTSSFTTGAVQYAQSVPQRIILIDGKRLTDLMIRYGVGVQVRESYHIVEIDEDFFA
jgi:restriction system protein